MCELRIKELCKERGLSMKGFGLKMGYSSASALSQALARGTMSLTWLEKAAKVLQVEVPDLFVRTKTTIQCPHCGKVITIKTED